MPVDHLGDRVLDLDARVHFDEVVVAVAVDDELDRAGVGVIGRSDESHGGFAHLGSRFVERRFARGFPR